MFNRRLFWIALLSLGMISACHTTPIPNPPVPPVSVTPTPTPGPFDYREQPLPGQSDAEQPANPEQNP